MYTPWLYSNVLTSSAGKQGTLELILFLFGNNLLAHKSGSRRDQAADDNIFLQSPKIVHSALDGVFDEDAVGILEGRRREPAFGAKRNLGDAEHYRLRLGFFAVLLGHAHIFFDKGGILHNITNREIGLAGIFDFSARKHLTDNNFCMLSGNGGALQFVNFVNFLNNIIFNHFLSAELKDASDIRRTIGQKLPRFYSLPRLHHRHSAKWHDILNFIRFTV